MISHLCLAIPWSGVEKGGEEWSEADEAFELGLGMWGGPDGGVAEHSTAQEQVPFRAWLEDWEETSRRKDDVLVKEKMLKKYKGIRWIDQDVYRKNCDL